MAFRCIPRRLLPGRHAHVSFAAYRGYLAFQRGGIGQHVQDVGILGENLRFVPNDPVHGLDERALNRYLVNMRRAAGRAFLWHMTIAWIYLDKKAAAISALKDYASMERIIRNYLDDAREARAHLTGMHMPLLTGTPGKANPRAPEAKMAATLDVIDVIEERYQQALEYMAWFRPAWEALTVEERHILSEFFLHDERTRADTLSSLCAELGYEKSAVYNRKDKALSHLALLLYGK